MIRGLFAERLVCALLWFMAGTLFFLAFPSLDKLTASAFYHDFSRTFSGKTSPFLEFISDTAVPFWALQMTVVALSGLLFAWRKKDHPHRIAIRQGSLLLILTLALGSGLVVNEVFKNNWGRARPSQISDFGGERLYTPPLIRHTGTMACDRNCSFVSGDASVGFALFAVAFAVPASRRRAWLIIASLAGGTLGLVRMAQGAHFLSDVFFSGLFVYMTALVLHRLLNPALYRAG